jgi:hypothetical protein
MSGAKDIGEALALLGARIERLEALSLLCNAGSISLADMNKAIDEATEEHEQDRELFADLYSKDLGPFNLEQYGLAQEQLEKKIASYLTLKELWHAEGIGAEVLALGLAFLNCCWLYLEPWRESLRQEIESDPEWIAEERRRALALSGIRDPFAKAKKKKQLTPQEKRDRAYQLINEAYAQEKATNGKGTPGR